MFLWGCGDGCAVLRIGVSFHLGVAAMSSSRKLKFRTVPRAPRYSHNKHAEPVPLANKFQELIEQEELSPSQSRVPVAKRPVDHGPTTSMAQRLQDLLGESASGNNGVDDDVGVQSKSDVAGGFLNLMPLHMCVLL